MSCFPSDEKRGRSSWFGVGLSRRDSPPCAGTIHKCEISLFASRSTSSQSNTTHFPSGDGTGAPTRLSFIMSEGEWMFAAGESRRWCLREERTCEHETDCDKNFH